MNPKSYMSLKFYAFKVLCARARFLPMIWVAQM
jgi:hypothetical protein